MKHHLIIILIFGAIICTVVDSCKIDEPGGIPEINITSPFSGQSFVIPDTVRIEADILNDDWITSIQVGLVDENFNLILPLVYLSPGQTNYNLKLDYPLNDNSIESGNYYIFIRAENKSTFRNKYQQIYITGIPKKLEKIIVITQKENNKLEISSVGSALTIQSLFEVDGDYASSETDSKNQQLYLAGISMINIQAYHLNNYELAWQKIPAPPLPMHSLDCFYFEENLYTSFASNYIFGYRYNGSVIFNTVIENNKLPSRITKYGEFLLADLQSKTGSISYLATYYLASGTEKQRREINYKIIDFHSNGSGKILIAANKAESGTLRLYDPLNDIETDLINIPWKITCSAELINSNYIISTEGSIYLYNLNQNSLTAIMPGVTGKRIRFEPLGQKIFLSRGNRIEIIDYPEIQIQNTILFEDSILNLHLFYNK